MLSAKDFFDIVLLNAGYYELKKTLLTHICPVDAMNLYSASHLYDAGSIRTLLKGNRWDINALLSRYFDKPNAFRSMMAKHGVIISGAPVLQFLDGVSTHGRMLDVYVPGDRIRDVVEYVVSAEGYYLVSTRMAASLSSAVRSLLRAPMRINRRESWGLTDDVELPDPKRNTNAFLGSILRCEGVSYSGTLCMQHQRGAAIRINSTHKHPLASTLSCSSSTGIANFITWNRCYSLFPSLTFKYRLDVVTFRNPRMEQFLWTGSWLPELAPTHGPHSDDRGCTAVLEISEGPADHGTGLTQHRRVGDNHSWILPLDTAGVDVSSITPTPDFVYEYATFAVEFDEKADGPMFGSPTVKFNFTMDCQQLRSPILEYAWVVECAKDGGDCFKKSPFAFVEDTWRRRFKIFAVERSKEAVELFSDDVRGEAFANIFGVKCRFPEEKPEGFTYADADVPGWYEAWFAEKENKEAEVEFDEVLHLPRGEELEDFASPEKWEEIYRTEEEDGI